MTTSSSGIDLAALAWRNKKNLDATKDGAKVSYRFLWDDGYYGESILLIGDGHDKPLVRLLDGVPDAVCSGLIKVTKGSRKDDPGTLTVTGATTKQHRDATRPQNYFDRMISKISDKKVVHARSLA
ncbi:MAG TPA: hypothetical protein VKV26_11735 [Dehalococcoidia bacterium]|nr:hypothetical protein [Dehalococcoidia bacterium]